MRAIEVWMAAAEAAPFAQIGGLADVLRALPSAVQRAGGRVRRFLPAYPSLPRAGFVPEGEIQVPFAGGLLPAALLTRRDPDGVDTTLVAADGISTGSPIYEEDSLEAARRFMLFSCAVAEAARRAPRPPDILHVHDWHAALVPLLARFTEGWLRPPKTVLTIHNMGYLGRFPPSVLEWLALDRSVLDRIMQPEGIEFHGDVAFLKAGLVYADALTAVSPTYAREITTLEFGFGLDGLMRHRAASLTGILNGCDYALWNPETDPHLPVPFAAGEMAGKSRAREALLDRLALEPRDRPVIGLLGRLASQKGIDLLVEAAPRLLDRVSLAILGTGDRGLEASLAMLRDSHPGRVGLHLAYAEPLAHLIIAGADMVLLPSRYEPCGLVQMHAMRYGTLPVVNPVGGLADTVIDEPSSPGRGTGFHLDELSVSGLVNGVLRALELRRAEPGRWEEVQRRAMRQDFSWDRAAGEYMALYRRLLA